jgi:hypothetical protein
MSERVDHDLDALLGEVAWAVDDDIGRTKAAWDFAAVVARAHELDPEQVPRELVREVEAAAPIVSLAQERRARRATRDDPEFDRIIADVRASVEHDAALRRHGVETTAARPVVAPARTGRRVLFATVAFAAAVVLAFGLLQGVRYVQTQRESPSDEALHLGESSQPGTEAATIESRERTSTRAVLPPPPKAAAPALEPAPLEPEVAVATPRRTSTLEKKKRATPETPPAPSLSQRLAELDAAAAAALRARDLPAAAAKFEQIVAQGGTSRLADLAFGELFHIAHRLHDTDGELALWKRYLARFPEGGRFADDARAGLCRRAARATKDACWRDYLVDFPKGSYVNQADAQLGSKAP